MKLHLSEFGQDGKRLFQLCWVRLLVWLRSLTSLNCRTFLGDGLLFLGQLRVAFVMLFLDDFLGVRDVSWISHRSNNKPRMNEARYDFLRNRRRWRENRAVRSDVCLAKLFRRLHARLSLHR